MARRTLPIPSALPLLGALAVATAAGTQGFGCAKSVVHGGPGDMTDDGGNTVGDDGSASGSGGSSGGGSGGSSSGVAAPPSVGVGLFGATCNKGPTTVDYSPI